MKKKIFIGTIIFILLLVTYLILVITNVLPNPFLDTKDLVCEKMIGDESFPTINKKIFYFDKKAIATSYDTIIQFNFNNPEDAKEHYEFLLEQYDQSENLKIILEEVDVKIHSTNIVKKEDKEYKKNKENIKNIYQNEYSYDCE